MSHHDKGMEPDGERGIPAQSSDDDSEGHAFRGRPADDDSPMDSEGAVKRTSATDDDDVAGHEWRIGTDR